jgi:cation:H+ antiporter
MTTFSQRLRRGLVIRGLVLLQPLDLVIGCLVAAFFLTSAVISDGDVPRSLQGALLIMLVMFVVGGAIEVIIEALRETPGLGTVVGFITNGPEALCLLVGLLAGDIFYAASTPLGSNFMNPVMLVAAALCTGSLARILRFHPAVTVTTVVVTAGLAGVFFALDPAHHPWWILIALVASGVLFRLRSGDPGQLEDQQASVPRWSVIPAGLLLVVAGYFLDPVVSFTAEASRAPKGLIGFFVLAALTSWPEFRSCLSLLQRDRVSSAVLNITVSNITNIWLALLGVAIHVLLR